MDLLHTWPANVLEHSGNAARCFAKKPGRAHFEGLKSCQSSIQLYADCYLRENGFKMSVMQALMKWKENLL